MNKKHFTPLEINRQRRLPCHRRGLLTRFTTEEAKKVGEALGIDWIKFDLEQFRKGMDVELEHGLRNRHTNVTNNNPLMTGKIALAHLNEFPDYYTRLGKMEKEAENFYKR